MAAPAAGVRKPPKNGRYGLGWGTLSFSFSPEPLAYHRGSNGMNVTYIVLQPQSDFAMVMATNVGGRAANGVLLAVARELYRRFAPR